MGRHVLSLEAPDTLNECILRIIDTSVYNVDMGVKCPLLQVTAPGFNQPVNFPESVISPGFSLNLTACDLELQADGCGTYYNPLSDGIYVLRYSASPNDIVFVEYNHLRITRALIMIQKINCDLELATCEPTAAVKEKLNKITQIRRFLEAAKDKVEYCHEPQKGMALYNEALAMIKKMDCKSC